MNMTSRGRRRKKRRSDLTHNRPPGSIIRFASALLVVLSQSAGCGPSYPKALVDQAIIQLCREEYKAEVGVKIMGSTVGVYIPVDALFDDTLNISKDAAKKINDVILSVSRVTLSTDAPLDFYIVVAQDPLLPEIEVVLIRYVKDLKMLHFDQLSRGEFIKRMVVAVKLTPQAQKEKVLRSIFNRLQIQDADNLIAEYLESSRVMSIGDIGYWNNTFYMKDITMGEFLAMQIADRVKVGFMENPELKENNKLNVMKGEYIEEGGRSFFRISFDATPLGQMPAPLADDADERLFEMALETAADVVHGYKFSDFWNVEIVNGKNNKVLFATAGELEAFRQKKTKKEELRQWYR